MAYFIRIKLKDNYGQVKINLDNVIAVSCNPNNNVQVSFIDGSNVIYKEGVHIDNAEQMFNLFPC